LSIKKSRKEGKPNRLAGSSTFAQLLVALADSAAAARVLAPVRAVFEAAFPFPLAGDVLARA